MTEKTELTLPERAAVALGTPKYEKELRELVAKSATITEVKNKDGREQAHGALMTLKSTRVAIEKTAKAAREDATAFSKAVIAEEKRLVAIAEPEETRLAGLRDKWDAEREAEKQAKAAAEKARVDGIRAKIEAFMLDAVTASAGTALEMDAHATNLSERVISLEEFGEFAGEAQVKRDNTVKWLRERQQQAAEREAEAARVAAEREQLARERAEAAERERIAEEARQAQAKKDREELAARQAEIAEQERKAREARQREEARLREIREEQEATQRAAQAAAEETLRRQQEEHERRMAAERAELARQQAEIAAAKTEQERIAREAQEAAEAAQRLESDHAEALIENARIDAEAAAQAEAKRLANEQQATEQERIRRAQAEFEAKGPEDWEIVQVIADHYDVTVDVARHWLGRHVWMEKAA